MKRQLTENQKLFLEYLFGEAAGDTVKAKRLAGYSDNYPTSAVVESLKEEIIEHTKLYLSGRGAKAAIKIVGIIDDPTSLGAKEALAAARDVLDRIGVVKTEKIDLGANGIFILPSKKDEEDDC